MNQRGFTLLEMLIALAISSVLMLGIARFLPALQMNNLRTLMAFQLHEELRLMMNSLEKAVRRAGYCAGECVGEGLTISTAGGMCLLVRWDENSNGKWEGTNNENSDYYGYRLRNGNLETQRGVSSCESAGWEKLNDPASVAISAFQITRADRQIRLLLSGYATAFPDVPLTLESWITAGNL
ncbi:prepilin peptidase-dependent protein [Pantoea sp. CCBC3-3-1]